MKLARTLLGLTVLVGAVGAGAAQDSKRAPNGTVNDVMIGITFPSSNIVNDAAYVDPEAPTDTSSFDAYGGWQKVETSAIAMAESATLLEIPGRACSNGATAPVGEADWQGWVEDLRESGTVAYEAARARSQETLMALSEQLIASCVDCHARYLDVGGDPNNRCTP